MISQKSSAAFQNNVERRRRRLTRGSFAASLSALGLLNRFRVVLDAADIRSARAAQQQWLNLGVDDYDFGLGASADATVSDPTLTGTPGSRTKDTYFLCDGGDYFLRLTAPPSWLQPHKAGAIFSGCAWVLPVAGVSVYLASRTQVATALGFAIIKNASDKLALSIGNGAGSALSVATAASLTLSAWNFIGWRFKEAQGVNGLTLQVNEGQERFTSTLTTPSAADVTTLRIGSYGNGNTPVPAGTRFRPLAFTDAEVSDVELMAIYDSTKGQYV